MTQERRWWDKERHADRRGLLMARGAIKSAIRSWFERNGYVEVEPAALQVSPGNEAHLHAFTTLYRDEAGRQRTYHLHTSPEFAMKKLIAAGETRIFAFAPVYRNAERSALHSPEFTMLEWYEAGAGYSRIMDHCEEMLRIAAITSGASVFERSGRRIDPVAAAVRMTVAEAFTQHAGIDLLATLTETGADRDELAGATAGIGVRVAADDTWSDLFSRIMVERIEPAIGNGRATILTEFPAVEAGLARRCPNDQRVSERFEVYACGVELANGFGELTDAGEQRRRFEAEMAEKARVYGESYPLDEDFLTALERMPAAAGIAMGFDRVVMLATGAPRIEDVMWTPVP